MLEAFVLVAIGMLFLYGGAEALVHGASRLALSLGISPLVVGLTIVSLGTSLPEAVASLLSQFVGGSGDIALGNVIGSNVANIGLVAGCAAVIRPIKVNHELIVQESLLMLGVTLLLLALMAFWSLNRVVGLLLLSLLVLFLVWQVTKAKNGPTKEKIPPTTAEKIRDIGWLLLGLFGLLIGGYCLVTGAVAVAKHFGISERVIGLTVVALGTSLPELATSVVAAWRGQEELSIGNVIGSNIFNILFIAGGVALITPITFSANLLSVDGVVMLAFSLMLWLMMWRGHGISRSEGVCLLLGYGGYVTYLFWA